MSMIICYDDGESESPGWRAVSAETLCCTYMSKDRAIERNAVTMTIIILGDDLIMSIIICYDDGNQI